MTTAALALASTRPKKEHGQLCPVWVNRMRKVRHAVPIDACDCWVLRDARRDAAVVIAKEHERLRDAVEFMAGQCHDGEGLGCESFPCRENVSRSEVLALLKEP